VPLLKVEKNGRVTSPHLVPFATLARFASGDDMITTVPQTMAVNNANCQRFYCVKRACLILNARLALNIQGWFSGLRGSQEGLGGFFLSLD